MFGHGDLCFNNILIEPFFDEIKLIDPKADFNVSKDHLGFIDPFMILQNLTILLLVCMTQS